MEKVTMGKVFVTAKIENLNDLFKAKEGKIRPNQIRCAEVSDALVDTGATMLSLPKHLIDQLGLDRYRTRRVRTSAGIVDMPICQAVRLTVQDREFVTEVAEIPDDCPVLIGQLPLEGLDFVVDPMGQKLIGNAEHGGEHMIEMY